MSVVIYEKKGKIAYVTLNRPEKLNTISIEVLDELEKTWVDFRDDSNLWVAILTGAGRAFCAGADLASLGKPGWDMNRVIPVTYQVWKPVIGAFHGFVLGGGLWLALGCDLRIAAGGAEFGFPEPKVGMAVKRADLLLRYMPLAIASELLLTGGRISAQRAYEANIVNKVVPDSELLSAATELAEAICENAPLAVRVMKQVLQRGGDIVYQGTENLLNIFDAVSESEDYQEGIRAFKEKRKPNWQAR